MSMPNQHTGVQQSTSKNENAIAGETENDEDSEVYHSGANGSGGGNEAEEDLDDIALMDSLRQLKHNYHKLQTEKKDMQRYCEEMEDTMEKKEQMVHHLKEHNTVLSRKLSKAQQNTQDIIDLERKLEAQKAESRQRRRKLPVAPQRTQTNYTGRAIPSSPSRVNTTPEILQAKINSLEAKCQRLQDDLDEAMHKAVPRPDGGDVAGNGDNELPHALSIATEYEKAQEAWEEERHELKATVHQTAEELCALEKVILETQDLLEETTVQLRSTEVELNLLRRMSRAGDADTSLADELSGNMHNTEAVQALADLALLREQLVKNQGQLDVARQERDEFSARLEARRQSSEAERKESDQRISLLEMEILELKQQISGDEPTETPVGERKGMTKEEQAHILKEKVLLKMQLDDVQTSLIDSKAEAAKAQWEQELFKLYVRNRDRIMHQILSRPTLSKKDRRIIASIVDETTPTDSADAPWRRGISTPTFSPDTPPGKAAPPRKISKVQIGSPMVSTFRKIEAPTALGENWSELLPDAASNAKQ